MPGGTSKTVCTHEEFYGHHSGSCGVGFVCNIGGSKSNTVVKWGIEAVRNLTHRGAVGADGKTGDGAGILLQIPRNFFLREIDRLGFSLADPAALAIGSFFLYADLEGSVDDILSAQGFRVAGWRDVPVDDSALGKSALSAKPRIRQLIIDCAGVPGPLRKSRLFLARRAIENSYGHKIYISSLSPEIVVYKGMLVGTHIDRFYPELTDEDFESAFCVFHQRFSTNTFPDWKSAQPLRTLAHNGEINTVKGNRNWMSYISHDVKHAVFEGRDDLLYPLISFEESDSASLDRIIELLMLSGRTPEQAINLCVPPSWENAGLSEETKAFFRYESLLMKPWDGPAAIVLTDGSRVCAHLDRNGLRPMRYIVTDDGFIILGSETGMVETAGRKVIERGRLGPGDSLSVDTSQGRVKHTDEIINEVAAGPYKDWMKGAYRPADEDSAVSSSKPDLLRRQIAFGYTTEEIRTAIMTMAESGREMTYSMGDDTPVPPLAEKPQLLFRYFKQRFSQVTNPPIDPIREKMVMSLKMALGRKRNFLVETKEHARRLQLNSPLLFESAIREIERQGVLRTERISITYSANRAETLVEPLPTPPGESPQMTCCAPGKAGSPLLFALRSLQRKVVAAVKDGSEIIILSDRDLSAEQLALPSLLALSACFRALARERLAHRASIVVESGEPRDIHQIACLIGYGASAVFPYLALETIGHLCEQGELPLSFEESAANYRKAVEEGLLKVIARLGISTLSSYQGAQLFDSFCLKRDFVEEFFTGTSVTIEADGLGEIEESLLRRHRAGFQAAEPRLDQGGNLRHRKGGEWHQWSTSSVLALRKFVRTGDESLYDGFAKAATSKPTFIRHLLGYRHGTALHLHDIETEELILKRFFSGAMSVGALSPEAHETIAEACNTLCIRSNSGEGGEDPRRYWTIRNSAIKQIASGRFGVTPAYLASAQELEIKIAQGAKPGEGGHLPAIKVTEYIAKLRHCSPNILLISPPPHHDIYSIEDLAQLINDLKEANPRARVCVKLVAEPGVGAVAAGVVKAYADVVQISGCEGGTGASPVGSIRNAGNYWEAGLAETQQVLIENGLREKIRVRVDGGLSTGRDVVIAALLGAEEFGFGTAAMISTGCIMARQCHLNTCPTGIATQDERLRAKFQGTADGVIAYFTAVAREVRGILAEMGMRSMEEIIGRNDLLMPVSHEGSPGARRIVLTGLIGKYRGKGPRKCEVERNDNPAPSMNDKLLDELLPYIEKAVPVSREYTIRNVDRSVPLKLNYHIALRYKDQGLPDETLRLTFRGTAGQSFGAFNHNGVSLTLVGDANDYVGKSMYGGRVVIMRPEAEDGRDRVIAGNTVLYGATGGAFYASGRTGERFAVRNSGAMAVIEGAGHHLCEYMTRGVVVVLGEVGLNVGAGMTGGLIYLLDESGELHSRLNESYVRSFCLDEKQEIVRLRSMIESHHLYTKSLRAGEILEDFDRFAALFRKILPV